MKLHEATTMKLHEATTIKLHEATTMTSKLVSPVIEFLGRFWSSSCKIDLSNTFVSRAIKKTHKKQRPQHSYLSGFELSDLMWKN